MPTEGTRETGVHFFFCIYIRGFTFTFMSDETLCTIPREGATLR